MGSNDKVSESPDHENASVKEHPAFLSGRIQDRKGPGDPERGRLMAADKGLSTCDELSEEMKQISLGGVSFAQIRKDDAYYVDKTLLIRDILSSDTTGVYLFTRPRRFGKTTNLSMLDAFFNIEYKGNTWFDGLEISEYPEYEKFKNAFPVIHIDLGGAKAKTYESFIDGMRDAVRFCFEPHRYLLDSPDLRTPVRKLFESLDDETITESNLKTSVKWLSLALTARFDKNPIILIDEYDRAVSDAFGTESHKPMMDFLSEFLYYSVKGNQYRQMAYVTGVMQVTKQSIFSGANNFKVNNVFSTRSDERFGFTESEVKKILEESGHPDKFGLAKEWYDGYRFGDAEVYNPFSIMSFVSEDCHESDYWADNGKDVLIKDLLQSISTENYTKIIELVTGGSIRSDLTSAFPYEVIEKSGGPLYSLMVMSGYLKAIPTDETDDQGNKLFELSIPNEEVRKIVSRMMKAVYPLDTKDLTAFSKAILDEDAKEMEKVLVRVMDGASYINLNEATYAAVIMTLTYSLSKRYRVKLEAPDGTGRVDIEFYPKVPGIPPMIFELKVAARKKDLPAKVAEAFEQIHDREYYNGMEGRVILVGLAFWNKVPKIEIGSVMNGDGFALCDKKAGRT